jgi:hypothetical protein
MSSSYAISPTYIYDTFGSEKILRSSRFPKSGRQSVDLVRGQLGLEVSGDMPDRLDLGSLERDDLYALFIQPQPKAAVVRRQHGGCDRRSDPRVELSFAHTKTSLQGATQGLRKQAQGKTFLAKSEETAAGPDPRAARCEVVYETSPLSAFFSNDLRITC